MKILIVTNLYPPHHLGGYELGCRDIAEGLRSRGHSVRVLTSEFRRADNQGSESTDIPVERSLYFTRLAGVKISKRQECAKLRRALTEFSPDLVYFSNQVGLCGWLPVIARRCGFRTVFFLSDTTFISWRVGAWLAGTAKKISPVNTLFSKTFLVRGWPVVQDQTCHFASEFLRQHAVKNAVAFSPQTSLVTHWGIDPSAFNLPRIRWPVQRLLYVGRLSPHKGVHTAINAMHQLVREKKFADLTLSLAGGGPDLEYSEQMRKLPHQLGIADKIIFLGERPREELPKIYAEHDVLVFPSEWDEPFAITPLEAIASGLNVVGTTTGGSGELFRNRETAMTFAAGNAEDCARALRELCADEKLSEKISFNARLEVRSKHTLDAMVDKIEKSLLAECDNG
jgi:glycosyltransferase involved in cell wall biosynthesis